VGDSLAENLEKLCAMAQLAMADTFLPACKNISLNISQGQIIKLPMLPLSSVGKSLQANGARRKGRSNLSG